jgi:hypothetical protein
MPPDDEEPTRRLPDDGGEAPTRRIEDDRLF